MSTGCAFVLSQRAGTMPVGVEHGAVGHRHLHQLRCRDVERREPLGDRAVVLQRAHDAHRRQLVQRDDGRHAQPRVRVDRRSVRRGDVDRVRARRRSSRACSAAPCRRARQRYRLRSTGVGAAAVTYATPARSSMPATSRWSAPSGVTCRSSRAAAIVQVAGAPAAAIAAEQEARGRSRSTRTAASTSTYAESRSLTTVRPWPDVALTSSRSSRFWRRGSRSTAIESASTHCMRATYCPVSGPTPSQRVAPPAERGDADRHARVGRAGLRVAQHADAGILRVRLVDDRERRHRALVEAPVRDAPRVGAPAEGVAQPELLLVDPVGRAVDDVVARRPS